MKRTILATALLLPLFAQAETAVIQDRYEPAKVLSYAPIPGPQVARQICHSIETPAPAHNAGGAVAGGLLGALVGSRFGEGHGRDALTVAGAIGGAMAGDQIGSGPATQRQCNVVYEPGPPSGYQVTYDYHGRQLTAITRTPPGEYLNVHERITVE